MHQIFAVCAPGLEPFLRRELLELGLLPGPAEDHPNAISGRPDPGSDDAPDPLRDEAESQSPAGGIEFPGGPREMCSANLNLRTATRILLRLSTIQARTLEQLRDKVGRMPWKFCLEPGRPVAVRATCHRSRLYHTDAVAQRVAEGIAHRLGAPAPLAKFNDEDDASAAPRLVVARVVGDRCTLSIDTSGPALHRRGYRQATAKAPLRETLAAAILLAARWDPSAPLLDPFCGSGAIPIEAALLARRIPPGWNRRFAFQTWPAFDPALWESVRADAARRMEAGRAATPVIHASDRDAGAVRAARDNARRAGVEHYIQFTESSISSVIPPPGPGWIVANPPYGVRIAGGGDLRNLYARFGAIARQRCPGWRVAILSADPRLTGNTGLSFDEGLPLRNGGLRVRLVQATIHPARA